MGTHVNTQPVRARAVHRWVALLASLICLACARGALAQSASSREYQVKAAFLGLSLLAPGAWAQGRTPLAQLTGWRVPGLEVLTVTDITKAETYVSGRTELRGIKADIFIFRQQGQLKANLFLRFGSGFKLSVLAPSLAKTPMDDIVLNRGVFLFVPDGNTGLADVPAPMAKRLGRTKLGLKPGLGVFADAVRGRRIS